MSEARTSQLWLPGLEGWSNDPVAAAAKTRRRRKRIPDIGQLQASASPRVRKLFDPLRDALLAEEGIAERVQYDDAIGMFAPSYLLSNRELIRIHLDPVLAATVTLDRGDLQFAKLLASDGIPPKVKSNAVKCARRSGRRVYLAFLARNQSELSDLVKLMREHVALAGRLTRRSARAAAV